MILEHMLQDPWTLSVDHFTMGAATNWLHVVWAAGNGLSVGRDTDAPQDMDNGRVHARRALSPSDGTTARK